jgi:SAM-dependent methyltransferase
MMMRNASPVFAQLAALADPTRSRVLLLLEQQPLTVGELCEVMQLPQSTVSRHLKVLVDEDWAAARADGASRVYRLGKLSPAARTLWQAVRKEVSEIPSSRQDVQRLRVVRSARRSRSAAFFAAEAGRWDAIRRDLFGEAIEVLPLLAMLDPTMVVGDLGCGSGQVSARLAPFVGRVIGVDASGEMIEAASGRVSDLGNVSIRQGQLEELPIETEELDLGLLILVLHYVEDPPRVLAEARRVLRPGGRLLIVDMVPHDRSEYLETMGHVWQGFAADVLDEWLAGSDLGIERRIELPPEARAKGPNLFAAVVRRTET